MAFDISIGFPISKVDHQRRYVGGWATTESLDKQGDVMDYDGSVAAFSEWPGNIREQHDARKAIGKAVEVRPEADTKRIWVGAYISKSPDGEATWTKVQEGILKGFSVKGESLESRPDTVQKDGHSHPANRITRYRLDELSLVDNPAQPEALICIVKGMQATDVLGIVKADAPPPPLPDVQPSGGQVPAKPPQPPTAAPSPQALFMPPPGGPDKPDDEDDEADDKDKKDKPDDEVDDEDTDTPAPPPAPGALPAGIPPPPQPPPGPALPPSGPKEKSVTPTEIAAIVARTKNEVLKALDQRRQVTKSDANMPAELPFPPGSPDDNPSGAVGDETKSHLKPAEPKAESKVMEIQQLHDLTVALGAKCGGKDHEKDTDTEKDPNTEEAPPALEGDNSDKSLNNGNGPTFKSASAKGQSFEKGGATAASGGATGQPLSKLSDLSALIEKQASAIATLEKRLADLEAQPASDATAPVVRPINKSLGGPDREAPGDMAAMLSKADTSTLEQLLAKSTNPSTRQELGYRLALADMKDMKQGRR